MLVCFEGRNRHVLECDEDDTVGDLRIRLASLENVEASDIYFCSVGLPVSDDEGAYIYKQYPIQYMLPWDASDNVHDHYSDDDYEDYVPAQDCSVYVYDKRLWYYNNHADIRDHCRQVNDSVRDQSDDSHKDTDSSDSSRSDSDSYVDQGVDSDQYEHDNDARVDNSESLQSHDKHDDDCDENAYVYTYKIVQLTGIGDRDGYDHKSDSSNDDLNSDHDEEHDMDAFEHNSKSVKNHDNHDDVGDHDDPVYVHDSKSAQSSNGFKERDHHDIYPRDFKTVSHPAYKKERKKATIVKKKQGVLKGRGNLMRRLLNQLQRYRKRTKITP